jgi:hypothetical protein
VCSPQITNTSSRRERDSHVVVPAGVIRPGSLDATRREAVATSLRLLREPCAEILVVSIEAQEHADAGHSPASQLHEVTSPRSLRVRQLD